MSAANVLRNAKPIIPWPGGKRRLAKRIINAMPEHTCYVEPFAGGAAVLFSREPADVEVINDVNSELVTLYRVVQHHLDELVRQFRWVLSSRQGFGWAQLQRPETLTDIQRAARFLLVQRSAFAGKVSSRSWGTATTATPRLNLLRLEEELSAAHCVCRRSTSSICRGRSASAAMTARTRSTTLTRRTGRRRATAWSSAGSSTRRSLRSCGPRRAR